MNLDFFYSRPIEDKGNFIGMILIEVDLKKFEKLGWKMETLL